MQNRLRLSDLCFHNGNLISEIKRLLEKKFGLLEIDFSMAPAVEFKGVKISSLLLIKRADVIKGYITPEGEMLPELATADDVMPPGYRKIEGETLPEIEGDMLAEHLKNDFKIKHKQIKKDLEEIGSLIEKKLKN